MLTDTEREEGDMGKQKLRVRDLPAYFQKQHLSTEFEFDG